MNRLLFASILIIGCSDKLKAESRISILEDKVLKLEVKILELEHEIPKFQQKLKKIESFLSTNKKKSFDTAGETVFGAILQVASGGSFLKEVKESENRNRVERNDTIQEYNVILNILKRKKRSLNRKRRILKNIKKEILKENIKIQNDHHLKKFNKVRFI